jgi:Ca2+-transporting ATPase
LTWRLFTYDQGLPLVVTLAMGFATKRMTHDNLLVRVLGSCDTTANSSVVCTHTTGTLTQNAMTVVAGSVGIHAKFVRSLDENIARTNAEEIECSSTESESKRKHPYDFSIDHAQLNTVLPTELQELFNEAIAINSTAFEDEDPETGKTIFVGSKTEAALLQFAKELDWRDARETREAADIVQMFPFSSERKAMAVVIKKPQGRYRAYFKGASEILARRSISHIAVRQDNFSHGIQTKQIDELSRENISRTIIFYANQMLRTIAIGYRDFETWPPPGTVVDEIGDVPFDGLADDLTLIAIIGIEDKLREGVRDAILNCQRAGVSVKMCTGDNALTARSIARQCGIFTPGGIIMEGPVFRRLSQKEMIEIVPRLQVLARSSPEDMEMLVEILKKIGEFVSVAGGANSGPALRIANVGFSMGIAGTEVTKEASEIILMDDNFESIVKAIMWGRCINDNVRKFLQFQVSTNITAVIITVVSALADDPALNAVQLLWINIIMDTLAALALATDPPSEKILDRKPDKMRAPLFSVEMYKMILLQSVYQIAAILIFHFLGRQILGLDHSEESEAIVRTLVFNAFVFAQIFNSVNCRRLDSQLNIFEGILRNRYFLVVTVLGVFRSSDFFHI